MRLKPATRYRLSIVLQYAAIFQVLTLLFYLIHLLTLKIPEGGDIILYLDRRILIAVFPGMLVGFVDEFVLRRRFKGLPFGWALLIRTFFHTLLLAFSILITYSLAGLSINLFWLGGDAPGLLQVMQAELNRIDHFFQTLCFYALQITIALSFFQIRRYIGRGRLLTFLTGKYIHPTWETNLLMFVDLKASTTIAEHLNSSTYSEFIRDFVSDISEPIYVHNGRIYQYVGDEVVVYWPMSKNKRKNVRPLHCFVGMMEAIEKRKDKYYEKYGVKPQFKAGLHGGPIIVAEVGDLKKEIAFHGTVINTTSRIQAKCNELDTNFLISDYIIEHAELSPDYVPFSAGKFLLKGKVETMELFTVEKAEQAAKMKR
jgi:adenylate cyclase